MCPVLHSQPLSCTRNLPRLLDREVLFLLRRRRLNKSRARAGERDDAGPRDDDDEDDEDGRGGGGARGAPLSTRRTKSTSSSSGGSAKRDAKHVKYDAETSGSGASMATTDFERREDEGGHGGEAPTSRCATPMPSRIEIELDVEKETESEFAGVKEICRRAVRGWGNGKTQTRRSR